jgi:hypothetical protein
MASLPSLHYNRVQLAGIMLSLAHGQSLRVQIAIFFLALHWSVFGHGITIQSVFK